MSARPAMQRQTKTGKTGKCLPDQQCRGRQNKENKKNICPTSKAEADKNRKITRMSARSIMQWRTDCRFIRKCPPYQHKTDYAGGLYEEGI